MDQAGVTPYESKMAIEYEKKYRLTESDYERLERRLDELAAKFEGEATEENTIFELTKLTGNAGVLRVRTVGAKTLLTLKRRIPSESSIKQQIEFETVVGDRTAIRGIIRELGLKPDVVYEKRRKTWSLEDCDVVLDTLPFGLFMEIEGPPSSIAKVESMLQACDLPVEPRTYPNLTAEFGTRSGGAVEARFGNT